MELHFPTVSSQGSGYPLERLRPGYVQLQPVGHDLAGVYGQKKNGRLTTMLEKHHRPFDEHGRRIKNPISRENIPLCTKLHFITRLLTRFKAMEINLDIAIVCSSQKTEDILVEALLFESVEYKALSQFQPAQEAPFHGVLIRFRKTQSTVPRFRMRVDHIIVYDPALNINMPTILHYFTGVCYDKPQIVSLVNLQSLDIRVCNFRVDNPGLLIDTTKPLILDTLGLSKLIESPKYNKIPILQRFSHNTAMLIIFTQWMALKDGTVFNSEDAINKPLPDDQLQPSTPVQLGVVVGVSSNKNTTQDGRWQSSIPKGAVITSNKSTVVIPTTTPSMKRSNSELFDEYSKRMEAESNEGSKRRKTDSRSTGSSAVNAEKTVTPEEDTLSDGMCELESELDKQLEGLKSILYG